MDSDQAYSAYWFGLGLALVLVIWLMIPSLDTYIHVAMGAPPAGAVGVLPEFVTHSFAPPAHGAAPTPGKLSASGLEVALAKSRQFPVTAQMRCLPSGRYWDYVCSFIPTPSQPRARLQFGVIVDSKRWLRVSSLVPAGTPVPAPQ